MQDILNEIEFQHRTSLWRDIRKYVGKGLFIHFSRVEKIGVNTSSFHSDPAGVYLYSLDWMVKQPSFQSGTMYAINYPYWFVCSVDKSATQGVTFSDLTPARLDKIASDNNWSEELRSQIDQSRSPSEQFWDYIRLCGNNSRIQNVNQAVQSLGYVHDDGFGIIHDREQNQILVRHPRIMKIIASGEQNGGVKSDALGVRTAKSDDGMGGMKHTAVEVLKALRGEHGGDIAWNKKLPSWELDTGKAKLKLSIRTDSFRQPVPTFVAQWGRAYERVSIKGEKLFAKTMDEIVDEIGGLVERYSKLAKAGKDLLFSPAAPISDIVEEVKKLGVDDIATSIENSAKRYEVEGKKVINSLEFNGRCYVDNRVDYRYSVGVAGRIPFISARGGTVSDLVADLVRKIDEGTSSAYDKSNMSLYTFYSETDYKAFVGMVAETTGIDEVISHYGEEIQIWQDHYDKQYVIDKMKQIYRY